MKKIRFEVLIISLILITGLFYGTQKVHAQEPGVTFVQYQPPQDITAGEGSDAVSGEIIVKYKDGQSPDELAQDVARREANKKKFLIGPVQNLIEDIGYAIKREKKPEDKFADVTQADKQADIKESEVKLKNIRLLRSRSQDDPSQLKNIYSNLSEVEYAVPNLIASGGVASPNDPLFSQQWYLPKISINQAWDIKMESGFVVAVVDSGIDRNHPDLAGRINGGWDFVNNDNNAQDDNYHGTIIAGIIGAVTNNSRGVSAIDRGVSLMPVKVLDNTGVGFWDKIFDGIKYAADNGAKVINVSIHSNGISCANYPPAQEAIDYARSKGSVIVTIAGNYGRDAVTSIPGSCSGVISVGATDSSDQRASFPSSSFPASNYGSLVDISAPGVSLKSTYLTSPSCLDCYTNGAWGTSFAAPQVAAAAALMLSVNPGLSADQVESILKNSADPITTDRPIGNRLNAYKSLLAALPPVKQALFGVIPVCTISSASWATPSSAVSEGTSVALSVQTEGVCDGRQVEFKIWEDDGIFGSNAVTLNPSPVSITGNATTTTWVSEYQCDGLNCASDPPEYYFEANIVGKSTKFRSAAPQLSVNKIVMPSPSPSPSPSIPFTVSLNHSPNNPAVNDTITFSVTASASSGIKNIFMYAAGIALTPNCASTATGKTCTATHKFTAAGQIGYAVDVFDNTGSHKMGSEIFQVSATRSSPAPSPSSAASPLLIPSPVPSPTPAPKSPPCSGYGDVTLDNFISPEDISWISDQIADKRNLTDEQRLRADVNGDNNITQDDVTIIQAYLQGSRANFDICLSAVISNLSLQSISKDSITLTWTTSAPATQKVVYGTSRTNLALSFPQTSPLSKSHSVTVPQLRANTLYFYKVQSQNGAGLVQSPLGVFRTKP